LELEKLKRKFITNIAIDLPKDYLSDEENREVKEKVDSFSIEGDKIDYLLGKGIVGYDDKEGKYYRSKLNDISNEDLNLIIQLENYKILKGIHNYLILILIFLIGSVICLSFLQPVFLSVIILASIYYFNYTRK
jgi:hypothetical protein